MRTLRTSIIALAVTLVCVAAPAQTADQLPGYLALEDLDIFAPGEVEVDVDLRDSMVKVIAGAGAQRDEDFSKILDGIKRIRVKAGSAEGKDPAGIRAAIDSAAARLEASGWYRMVTVRDEDEVVYVLALEGDNVIHGLTAMIHDGDEEVVLVNIAGDMTPEMIGSLLSHMDELKKFDLDLDLG